MDRQDGHTYKLQPSWRPTVAWSVTRRRPIATDFSGQPVRSIVKGEWVCQPLNMGPIVSPETSVTNYQTTPLNNPEERNYAVAEAWNPEFLDAATSYALRKATQKQFNRYCSVSPSCR